MNDGSKGRENKCQLSDVLVLDSLDGDCNKNLSGLIL